MILMAILAVGLPSSVAVADSLGVPGGAYTDKTISEPIVRTIKSDGSRARSGGEGMDGPFDPVREAGQNRALTEALDRILPMDCWEGEIEYGLEDTPVSWGTGPEWPGVLRRAVDRAGLSIHFNYNDCLVAIADDARVARAMAMHGGNIWRVESGDTLRETLEDWAERAGWRLSWEVDTDYEIQYGASIIGHFRTADGESDLLDTVLEAYEDAPIPLRDRWQTSNRVLRIVEDRGRSSEGSR